MKSARLQIALFVALSIAAGAPRTAQAAGPGQKAGAVQARMAKVQTAGPTATADPGTPAFDPVINTIRAGAHYLSSAGGHYNFGPKIGELHFHGRPMGPGNTDTIYRRLGDVTFPGFGSSAKVPIEMVAVSLESIEPVTVDGRQYDVFIHLTPGRHSTGEMTFSLHYPNDGASRINGTYDTNVNIFFTAEFTPRDGGAGAFSKDAEIFIQSTAPGRWSFNPNVQMVMKADGPEELRTSNFFLQGTIPMLDVLQGAGGANTNGID